jgi:hypothetical protein
VEEALRLMAVQRDVGGVQIEHDLSWRRGVRLEEQVRQQPVDGFSRVADLVIASRAPHQLQPVQRALAGQRLVQLALAAEQSQQRIVAQLLVIVEVLIAQRQPVDALREHLGELVGDQQRRAAICKTARQPPQQADPPLHLTQQQGPAVARYLTSREPGLDTARKMGCKCERFLVTLCHWKGRLRTAKTTS